MQNILDFSKNDINIFCICKLMNTVTPELLPLSEIIWNKDGVAKQRSEHFIIKLHSTT